MTDADKKTISQLQKEIPNEKFLEAYHMVANYLDNTLKEGV